MSNVTAAAARGSGILLGAIRGEVGGGCERGGRKESRVLGFAGDHDALLFVAACDACESKLLGDEMDYTTFSRRKVL